MVRNVTLFRLTKESVSSYSKMIPMMYYEKPIRSLNSDDIFLDAQVRMQYMARIKRICKRVFVGQDGEEHLDHMYKVDERFIAFDRELEEIFNMFNAQHHDIGVERGRQQMLSEVAQLKDQIESLQSRTIWSMIVS